MEGVSFRVVVAVADVGLEVGDHCTAHRAGLGAAVCRRPASDAAAASTVGTVPPLTVMT